MENARKEHESQCLWFAFYFPKKKKKSFLHHYIVFSTLWSLLFTHNGVPWPKSRDKTL